MDDTSWDCYQHLQRDSQREGPLTRAPTVFVMSFATMTCTSEKSEKKE